MLPLDPVDPENETARLVARLIYHAPGQCLTIQQLEDGWVRTYGTPLSAHLMYASDTLSLLLHYQRLRLVQVGETEEGTKLVTLHPEAMAKFGVA